jgi:hypothetical protein
MIILQSKYCKEGASSVRKPHKKEEKQIELSESRAISSTTCHLPSSFGRF